MARASLTQYCPCIQRYNMFFTLFCFLRKGLLVSLTVYRPLRIRV
uniref:Uncharacterized protein n=1 Tax=Anguilla anguilla TaxID=7936 RepID=A0A0E9SCS4_ANGAN